MGEAEHFLQLIGGLQRSSLTLRAPRADPQEPLTRGLFALRRGRGES